MSIFEQHITQEDGSQIVCLSSGSYYLIFGRDVMCILAHFLISDGLINCDWRRRSTKLASALTMRTIFCAKVVRHSQVIYWRFRRSWIGKGEFSVIFRRVVDCCRLDWWSEVKITWVSVWTILKQMCSFHDVQFSMSLMLFAC